MRTEVVDLFCGIGGLSYGFKNEGFTIKAGFDSDESCKYAFETNVQAPFFGKDIRQLAGSDVAKAFARDRSAYRVLIGCAPCAPFSMYMGRYRKAKRHDQSRKWELLREFSRLIRATKPHVVSMENVPRLRRHPVFNQFVAGLRRSGYTVSHYKVMADRYGVPQRRSRLVLFASLFGKIDILPATHLDNAVTVRDAIGKLPKIKAGVPSEHDRLHVSRALSHVNLLRLRSTKEGGSWKDWSEDLQLRCHKKPQGRSFRSVYGRMRWNAPAPVITTQCLGIGNGRFGHPDQHRAISVREAALLQTFPMKFRFVPPRGPIYGLHLARQIGNAVPVRLSCIIARSIKNHLKSVTGVSDQTPALQRGRRQRSDF